MGIILTIAEIIFNIFTIEFNVTLNKGQGHYIIDTWGISMSEAGTMPRLMMR